MSKRLTQEEFLVKFYSVYDEDDFEVISEYINAHEKITIRCKHCGKVYSMRPDYFFKKENIFVCYCQNDKEQNHDIKTNRSVRKINRPISKLTHEDFCKRFYEKYDDSYEIISEYKSIKENVIVRHKPCGTIYTKTADLWLTKNCITLCHCDNPREKGNKITHEEYCKRFYEKRGTEEFTIVSQYTKMADKISIRHNKCGHVFKRHAQNALEQDNLFCPCQDGHDFVPEINSIAVVDRDFAKLFLNPEDAWKYSIRSGLKSDFKCLECNQPIYNKEIRMVHKRGLKCPYCSDGISYPEKIMYSLLSDYVDIFDNNTFYYDNSFDWSDSRKYDFYFYINNILYVIEVHGIQHYEEVKRKGHGVYRTLEQEQENDEYKKKLALLNGVAEMNYIVVDARYSDFNFIINNIKKSNISLILKLDDYDWNMCEKRASESLVKKACDIYNETGGSVKEIAKIIHSSETTAREYLKKGKKIGLCDFIPKKVCTKVRCKNNGLIFDSIVKAKEYADLKSGSTISGACSGLYKYAGKDKLTNEPLLWEYIESEV